MSPPELTYNYLFKEGISNIKGGLNVLYDMNYPKEIIENTIEIQKLNYIYKSKIKILTSCNTNFGQSPIKLNYHKWPANAEHLR